LNHGNTIQYSWFVDHAHKTISSFTGANLNFWIQWLGLSLLNTINQKPGYKLSVITRLLHVGQPSSLPAARDMSVFESIQPGSGAHPTSCLMIIACYFPEVNWLMCKTYHSLLSRTEAENEWSCTSNTTVCLHGTDRPPLSLLNMCNSVCAVHCHLS
jgi:hypothetical protein